MSTTTIKFTMKDLDGTVVPYTQFQVASGRLNTGEVPDVMPATTSFTTDANGQASVVLTVTEAPYYLSKLDGSTDKVVAYKFFVPASDVTLEAELLYVDLGRTSKFYNDKSVAALIEAKVTAVNAANRALQVVTTLGSLDTLRTNLGSIISVGTDIAAVNTVATNIASVNAVNAASTTISAVNAALTNINAVGSSIASVNTVASNIGNVSTVVGMSANIASVVANATDIDTVANNMTDVQAAADALPGLTAATTIAPYITQITDVASNITTVSAVGNNIENINDVAGMEADIEALADNLDSLALAAAAVTQAVDAQKQLFTVGVDYSYGISTALALTYVPAKANAVKVFFDGEYQTKDSFNVVHHTITFNSPIVASKVEVQYDVPSSFVGLTPSDLVTLQTAETNASNSASASAVSAAASLASEIDAQQSASAAAVSASSMQQAEDGVKELFVAGIDYTVNTSTTITLDAIPAKSNSVLVFFDGVYKHTSSWNRVGTSIIFNAPITAALVEVWYQVPSLLVALTPVDQAILDAAMLAAANSVTAADASADAAALSETAAEAAAATVSAAVDGVKDLYVAGTHYTKNVSTSVTLTAAPNKPNTVKVFFNGVYQNKDTYYLVGSTINFGVVGTPDVIDADSVEVQYEIPSQFVGLSSAEQAVLTAAQSNALASANAAALDAADAEAAKVAAEAAVDAVNGATGLVFTFAEGTAAGLAATVDSEQFSVLSEDQTYWTIYRNDAGVAQAVGPGNYTKAYVDSLGVETVTDGQEPIFSVVDEAGKRTWLESNINGAPTQHSIAKIGEILTPLNTPAMQSLEDAQDALSTSIATSLDALGFETVTDGQEPIFSVVDEAGRRTWLESNINGAPTVHAAEKIGSVLTPENTPGLLQFEEIDETLNDISVSIVDSAGRRTWVEAKLDGKPTSRAALLVAEAMQAAGYSLVPTEYKSSYQDPQFKVASGPDIWCIGDSMTAGAGGNGTTYPIVLQSLLTADGHTGTVRNSGVGGETSVTITARTGAYPFIVNVTGGSIPASGGVAITFRSINGQPTQPLLQGSSSMVGMLGDVPGTVSQSGGTYTFTRTTAGTSIVADRPLAFYRDDNKLRRGDIAIIWIGQNGPSNTRAIEDARAIVQYLTALDKRFLVISKPGGTSSSDTDDAAWFAEFGRRFLPVRQYMVEFGLQDAGITPTSQDLTDIAAGTVPTSLRVDSVHWTAAGYTILGNLLFNRLKEMGWV